MMNVLDTVIVEEAIRDGKANGAIEKARTQIMVLNGWGGKTTTTEGFDPDDLTEYSPDGGYEVTPREKVTGEFHEGVRVHNPATFRLEPSADGSTDSPFA